MFTSPLFRHHPDHAYGLAISDTSLELVNMANVKSKLALVFFSRVMLESGIIERGYIRKFDAFARAVKDLTKNLDQGDSLTVVSALPDYQVFTRLLSFGDAEYDGDTIDTEIKTIMSKSLPLDFTEVVIRNNVYEAREGKREIMAYATHRSLIENWEKTLKKSNIRMAALEMTSQAMIRSLIRECPVGVSYVLVDIGASSSDICIFDCHGVKLSASMATGGRHFTETIAQAMQLDFAKAEEQKCSVGLKGTGNSMVTPILLKELEPIAQKIVKEIEYFERTGQKVKKIILAGGSSSMAGIVPYFQEHCKRETEQGHPWIGVQSEIISSFALSSKKLPENQEHLFTAATGLALRGLNKGKIKSGINFL